MFSIRELFEIPYFYCLLYHYFIVFIKILIW